MVDAWEVVGTFDREDGAKLKAQEYFARKKCRYMDRKTNSKHSYHRYRCAEHMEDKDKCSTQVRSRRTNLKYVVDFMNSGKCKARYEKDGDQEVTVLPLPERTAYPR
ncbi:unnamed protein product [Bathycoccus prasinos]